MPNSAPASTQLSFFLRCSSIASITRAILTSGSMRPLRHKPDRSCAPKPGHISCHRQDALTFIEETGEFVCNLATFDLREAVNDTSAPLPRGVSEIDHAGLTAAPSRVVRPPRVAEAPAALECRWLKTVPLEPLGDGPAAYFLVIGQVIGVHIDDRFIQDGV